MEIIKEYFNNFDLVQLLEVCKVIVPVLLALLLFFKTGNSKHLETTLTSLLLSLNKNEEVSDSMIYRKQHYKEGEKTPGQTYDSLKAVYRLNKVTGELEDTGEKLDIQEVIDSCKDACLNAVLERFFPTEQVDDVSELPQLNDDLDIMLECSDIAEEYRSKLGLADNLSIGQIFDAMKDYQIKLNEKLKSKDKEVKDGEKKIEQESVKS